MPRPIGRRSRQALAAAWAVIGAGMVAVAAWVALTRSDPLIHGHPLGWALTGATGIGGLLALAWSVATLISIRTRSRRPPEPVLLTRAQQRFRARGRVAVAVPTMIICLLALIMVGYTRPFAASADTAEALRSTATVRVVDRITWYELVPTRDDDQGDPVRPTRALVFAPGARVDPRAYAPLLEPLARKGILVCVLKEPLGLSVLQPKQAEVVLDAHPTIKVWAVGGHSLGGATISSVAQSDGRIRGLVLWGSYPIDVVDRSGLAVLSVSGSADGLATPADLAANRSKLPADTTSVVVDGAVHAYFGDYGVQPGDGTATVSRSAAQTKIIGATASFVAGLQRR